MSDYLVEFYHVQKAFGRYKVFIDFNLKIKKGDIHYVIGRSGSGKSVMIKHILGFLKPDTGIVRFDGKDVSNFNEEDWLNTRKKVGILFQDSALFDSMNVFENVAFPMREHTKKSEQEISDLVLHKLTIVGLGKHSAKMPSELSGGMRKRVALARAIALDPELVLFDEPSSGLDPIVTTVIDNLILDIQKEAKATFVVISHDMQSTNRVASHVSMLYDGKIIFSGTTEELNKAKDPLVVQFINGKIDGPFNIFY